MTHTTRTVISKSAKRKMSTQFKKKADTHTEQVVYKTALGNGKFHSQTKHEVRH